MAENTLEMYYESIIGSLIDKKFAVADDFFSKDEVNILRTNLTDKFDAATFKKSAIGNHSDKMIVEGIRGDFISWIDESKMDIAEQLYFNKVNNFIDYLNNIGMDNITKHERHLKAYFLDKVKDIKEVII